MAVPGGPLACFSYLAAASLWTVGKFPTANHAATVQTIEESIAADGPMVAATLAAMGQPSLLLANSVGNDRNGDRVHAWLHRHQVKTTAEQAVGMATPQIVVVGDDHHTRTMFPYLPGVADELGHIDLAPLASASFTYIDGYGFMGKAAARAIQVAKAANVPLLVNLGGDRASDELLNALDGVHSRGAGTWVSADCGQRG